MNELHTDSTRQPKVQKEGWRSIASSVAILLAAPLVAVFLTAFVFQSYQVDGPSMQSTLQPNDRLIVWKLSRTWAKITHHQYVPKRGDVIVFVPPTSSNFVGEQSNRQLIKRVIGLPGERVVVKNGTVTVYSKKYPNGFQPDRTLPYGNVIMPTLGEEDFTVPADSLYVLGDNRGDSMDSRIFGPVKTKDVIGKLVLRLFPFSDMKRF